MAAEIQFQENSSFSENHPQERLYQLNAAVEYADLLFGFLYVSSELSTLIWQGSLDFTLLEQEALDHLPRVIRSGSLRQPPEAGTLEETASASFILEAEELHVHSLTQMEQYHQYREDLRQPARISFVRYDVTEPNPPLRYTFTAENPNWSSVQQSELTIQLPKWRDWSVDLLEWVIEHHVEANVLRREIDPILVINTISKLLVLYTEEQGGSYV